ncbi:MAG: hypothetical protein ACM30I_05020 [Gemmatimonas sp.]
MRSNVIPFRSAETIRDETLEAAARTITFMARLEHGERMKVHLEIAGLLRRLKLGSPDGSPYIEAGEVV